MHPAVDDRGQPGVGKRRDRPGRVPRQVAQRLVHLDGARRAVDPDHVGAHRLEGAERGGDLGAGEHSAGEFDRHLDLQWHGDAGRGHRPPAGGESRLGAQQVELRLDEEQVDATLEEGHRLDLVGVAQRGVADLAEGGELRPGPHAAGDEARVIGRRVAVRDLPGELGGPAGELGRTLGDLVLGEHDREGAERVGLDDVHTDVEERAVEVLHDVRACHDEHLVAALELRSAEVVRSELAQLQVRAGRAVEDDDALGQQVEVSGHGPPRLPGGQAPAAAGAGPMTRWNPRSVRSGRDAPPPPRRTPPRCRGYGPRRGAARSPRVR